jgi:pimeloyl-ACP methyl ester carboxylesterase
MNLLNVTRRLYRVDDTNLNLAGFSQGATLVLELARRLDRQQRMAVRRVFAVAGSVVETDGESLAFPGADVIHYEPGHNTLQRLANLRTGESSEQEFMPTLLAAKACVLREHKAVDGVDIQIYACGDGRSVTRIYERNGEHAWPGQPGKYDIWLLGRGSISNVKMTDLLIAAIASSDAGRGADR